MHDLSVDEEVMKMTLRPWLSKHGKAAFYRQIAQADSAFTDEVQARYAEIDRPVLIIWGNEDAWIPVNRGETLHEKIPDSLFQVIPDAGHLVIEEQPDQLVTKIKTFLTA